MQRTLVNEMGHALLGAAQADHCTDQQCIMFEAVAERELRDFGLGDRVNKPGGSKDIQATGVIHNTVH